MTFRFHYTDHAGDEVTFERDIDCDQEGAGEVGVRVASATPIHLDLAAQRELSAWLLADGLDEQQAAPTGLAVRHVRQGLTLDVGGARLELCSEYAPTPELIEAAAASLARFDDFAAAVDDGTYDVDPQDRAIVDTLVVALGVDREHVTDRVAELERRAHKLGKRARFELGDALGIASELLENYTVNDLIEIAAGQRVNNEQNAKDRIAAEKRATDLQARLGQAIRHQHEVDTVLMRSPLQHTTGQVRGALEKIKDLIDAATMVNMVRDVFAAAGRNFPPSETANAVAGAVRDQGQLERLRDALAQAGYTRLAGMDDLAEDVRQLIISRSNLQNDLSAVQHERDKLRAELAQLIGPLARPVEDTREPQ